MTPQGPPFIPMPPGGRVDDNEGYTHELLLYGDNHESPFYVLADSKLTRN